MTNAVLLNNVDHAELRILTRHAPEYGDAVRQAPVFPTEFEEVQREYPIFFRKDSGGAFEAIALLGLDEDENLFLDAAGWQARYVPAVQRRGPFMIGFREREVDGEPRREPMIHVDLDHPRIAAGDGEGEPLFLPHGGNAPYLEHIAAVLRLIHQGLDLAGPMFAAFTDLGLIRPVAIEIELGEAGRYDLTGLFTIDEDRLARLDGPALARLHEAGFLRSAFHAAASLGNVQRLVELKTRRTLGDGDAG
jgi:hypothetical protein